MRLFGRGKSQDPTPSSPAFTFDGDPRVESARCDQCEESHDVSSGLLLANDSAFAAYWANWYPHEGEAWVDVAMGSWVEPQYSDHVTFGCRIGVIGDVPGPQCSLVQAAEFRGDASMFGSKLSRDEALSHSWLPTFWDAIDWLVLNDPLLHKHVFHIGEQ